ncbi:MAG: hypothetical protein IPG67_17155 [Acidobacteria bacterium]|nr:hypothetical protein [Acidobacteriota bacterium]
MTRGREDDVEPDGLPWPMSRRDLSRFEHNGLTQTDFVDMPGEEGSRRGSLSSMSVRKTRPN